MKNMKINLAKILLLFSVLFSLESYAQESATSSSENILITAELNNLIGEWTGSLTYLDYSSNKPYTMPANLLVKQGKNENQLLLFNVYPDEPKANSNYKMILSKNGRQLNKKDIKSKLSLPEGQIQITIEYTGKDNKKKALIRNIYLLGEKQFVIRKEVQFENKSEWIKRNEFSYKR